MKWHIVGQVTVSTVLLAAWAAVLGWIPNIAGFAFGAAGDILSILGGLSAMAAAWFRSASDEPHEKVIWGALGLVALGLIAWLVITAVQQLTPVILILSMLLVGIGAAAVIMGRRN